MLDDIKLQLHDFEIVSVYTDRSANTLELGLIAPNSKKINKVLLEGVDRIHISNFIMQNVILDVIVFAEPHNDEYYEFCKKKLDLSDNWFFENSQKCILYIEPSVGLEMCCIATKDSINKIQLSYLT